MENLKENNEWIKAENLFNKLFKKETFYNENLSKNWFSLIVISRESDKDDFKKIISYNKTTKDKRIFLTITYNPKNWKFHYYSEESKYSITEDKYLKEKSSKTKEPIYEWFDMIPTWIPLINEKKAIKILESILNEIDSVEKLEEIFNKSFSSINDLKDEINTQKINHCQ